MFLGALIWDWSGSGYSIVDLGLALARNELSRFLDSMNCWTTGSRVMARPGAPSVTIFMKSDMTVAAVDSFSFGFRELTARIMTLMPLKWC